MAFKYDRFVPEAALSYHKYENGETKSLYHIISTCFQDMLLPGTFAHVCNCVAGTLLRVHILIVKVLLV